MMYNKKRKEDKLMDMLVNLYDLKETKEEEKTFQIQRILSPNIYLLEEFIKKYFHPGWASEAKAACYKANPTCFIATMDQKIVGFACYDATAKCFFGPLGVALEKRNQGIAKALVLRTLKAMKEDGYAYAIIGSVGENVIPFYEKVCQAVPIGGEKSVYQRMI